jgi:proline iminopeptidase
VWGIIFRDIDICKGPEKFNKPVFLALGKFDFLTGPVELWNDRKKCFKDIAIRVFEKSSHSPQFEEPRIFDNELLTWPSRKLGYNTSK